MNMPFTADEFMEVFKTYNTSVWPFQLFMNVLAIAAVFFAYRQSAHSNKIVISILAFFWVWMGLVYHIGFFSAINKAAFVFGAAFVLQGILLVYYGFSGNGIQFRLRSDMYGVTGGLLILYAVVIYPMLGFLLGHIYPATPTFGLPCPTTIFTLGMLLWADKKLPLGVFIVPLLWSIIGFSAALQLGIREDIGLLVAGLAYLVLWLTREKPNNLRPAAN